MSNLNDKKLLTLSTLRHYSHVHSVNIVVKTFQGVN